MDRTSMGVNNNAGINMKYSQRFGDLRDKSTMKTLWDNEEKVINPSRLLFLILTVGVAILSLLPLVGILSRVLELWNPSMLVSNGVFAMIFVIVMDNLGELHHEGVSRRAIAFAWIGLLYTAILGYMATAPNGSFLNMADVALGPSLNYQYIMIICVYSVYMMHNLYEQVVYRINHSLNISVQIATIMYAALNYYLLHQMSGSYREYLSDLNMYTIAALAIGLVGMWALIMLRKRK